MKKACVIGLSVTADKSSYAVNAAPILKEKFDIDLQIIGIAGMYPYDLAHLLNLLKIDQACEVVFIEMFTATRLAYINNIDYMTHICYVIYELIKRQKKIGFINLYRSDTDYTRDPQWLIYQKIAGAFSIQTLDLSGDVANLVRTHGVAECLSDVVHPKQIVTDLYTERFVDFAQQVAQGPWSDVADLSLFDKAVGSTEIQKIRGHKSDRSIFKRTGVEIGNVHLKGGESLDLTLDEPRKIIGLSYIKGPKTGGIKIYFDGNVDVSLSGYDPYCYYERLSSELFDMHESASLKISQSADVPSVKLLKGEKDSGPRLGKYYAIYWRSKNDVDISSYARYLLHKYDIPVTV